MTQDAIGREAEPLGQCIDPIGVEDDVRREGDATFVDAHCEIEAAGDPVIAREIAEGHGSRASRDQPVARSGALSGLDVPQRLRGRLVWREHGTADIRLR